MRFRSERAAGKRSRPRGRGLRSSSTSPTCTHTSSPTSSTRRYNVRTTRFTCREFKLKAVSVRNLRNAISENVLHLRSRCLMKTFCWYVSSVCSLAQSSVAGLSLKNSVVRRSAFVVFCFGVFHCLALTKRGNRHQTRTIQHLTSTLFQDMKYKFMVAVLIEYIKSLNQYQIPAQVRPRQERFWRRRPVLKTIQIVLSGMDRG